MSRSVATRCGRSNEDDVRGRIRDRDAVKIADNMNDGENWTGAFYELCLVLCRATQAIADCQRYHRWPA